VAKARKVKRIDCREPVDANARRIIATRLAELLSYTSYVDDPGNVVELHDMRIAAKRLRYTLELFRFAFPRELEGHINEIKQIQEHIGDMHDADVMIARVVETLNRDADERALRLIEIASATERGTVAQRHQRIRSAMANRTTPRDEIAYLTLLAHRADDRRRAYDAFVRAWKALEESDFPGRLRRCVGLDPPLPAPAPAMVPEAPAVEPAPVEVAAV
jgi:hypothetical protein